MAVCEPVLAYILREYTFDYILKTQYVGVNATVVQILDIQNLRLVCKRWCSIVTQWFMREWGQPSFALVFRLRGYAKGRFSRRSAQVYMNALVASKGTLTFAFSTRNVTRSATFTVTDNEISMADNRLSWVLVTDMIKMARDGTLLSVATIDPNHNQYLSEKQIEELPGVIIPKLRKCNLTTSTAFTKAVHEATSNVRQSLNEFYQQYTPESSAPYYFDCPV